MVREWEKVFKKESAVSGNTHNGLDIRAEGEGEGKSERTMEASSHQSVACLVGNVGRPCHSRLSRQNGTGRWPPSKWAVLSEHTLPDSPRTPSLPKACPRAAPAESGQAECSLLERVPPQFLKHQILLSEATVKTLPFLNPLV